MAGHNNSLTGYTLKTSPENQTFHIDSLQPLNYTKDEHVLTLKNNFNNSFCKVMALLV